MPNLSTRTVTWLHDWLKGGIMPEQPSTTYVALFSADPTDAGLLVNEITALGRVPARFGTIGAVGGAHTISTSAPVSFGQAPSAITPTHFGIFASGRGADMIASGTVSGGPYAQGDAVSFAPGSLAFTVS